MEKDLLEEFIEEEKKKEFQEYVKEVTPTHNLGKQMINAFLCGGIICTIGQGILNLLFPPKCTLCASVLEKHETDLCRNCRTDSPECFGTHKNFSFLDSWTAVWY